MTETIDIGVAAPVWERVPDAQEMVVRAIQACRARLGRQDEQAETSVVLSDDAEIRTLNKQWRGKDSATNVLSFPTPPGPAAAVQLGEIIIAFETVAREAADEGKPFAAHLTHLVVHGYLHLVGYDHIDDEQAEDMEQMEREILFALGVADPYESERSVVDERLLY